MPFVVRKQRRAVRVPAVEETCRTGPDRLTVTATWLQRRHLSRGRSHQSQRTTKCLQSFESFAWDHYHHYHMTVQLTNDSAIAKKSQSISIEEMDQKLLDAARRADLHALLEAARAREAARRSTATPESRPPRRRPMPGARLGNRSAVSSARSQALQASSSLG